MAEDSRLQTFYALSAALTGFDRFDLLGTGQGRAYFATVEQQVSEATLSALLGRWDSIVREYPENQNERDAVLADAVVRSADLGPAARRIIMLWYTGSWYDTPTSSAVVSADTYVEGLMWKAIDSHPMAAKPQGFGAWAMPPTRKEA